MQVTETLSDGLKREFSVVLPAKDLEERLTSQLVDMKDKVRINGFRPGKVPVQHLRRVYGRSVMADVLQNLVNETNRKIVEDNHLKLALEPQIVFPEDKETVEAAMEARGDLSYKVGAVERALLQAHVITTSNPTITVQYKKTAGIGGGTDITRRGDPAMMLVPPAEQFMDKYRFISIQAYIYDFVGGRIQPVDSVYLEQWLNVVIPTVSLGSLVLDGVPIDQTRFLQIGNSAYSWARLPMRDGVHEIKADTILE